MANRSTNTPSPTRILFFGMVTAFLMMSYQNCGKSSGHNSGSSVVAISSTQSEINPPVLKNMLLAQNQNYIFYPVNASQPFEWPDHVYNVNLNTGVILKQQPDHAAVTFCLNDEWKNELQNLMQNSAVCLQQFAPPAPGIECTEDESVPHTQISDNNGKIYGLGGYSACPTVGYDICQDQLANYKLVLSQFLSVVETLSCQ